MQIITTKSFKLAINAKGDKNSNKIALLLPGRLDTKDYINFNSHLDFLAGKDFLAVVVDPPGTWESPGEIDLFTTTNYIKAVNELILYFGNKPTLLLGHSRGGTVAILAGTENEAVMGIVVVMATYGLPSSPTPEDLQAGVHLSSRDLPPGDHKTQQQKEFALPLNYFDDGALYDVKAILKKCTKPKLLFYGTDDDFVTAEEISRVYKIIPEPKMICELNSDHDYRYFPEIIEKVNEVTGEFLEEGLKSFKNTKLSKLYLASIPL